MTQVLISCPNSGDLVPTGVYAAAIEDLAPSPYVLSWCPGCDGSHEWIREDAIASLAGKPMPPVQISCPTTGDLVPTGAIAMSLEELGDEPLLLIACSECGRDHEWTRGDAVLAPE